MKGATTLSGPHAKVAWQIGLVEALFAVGEFGIRERMAMGERIARLKLTLQGWTGWSREQPAPETFTVEARRGRVLGGADFGVSHEEIEDFSRVFGCQIRVMTLLEDRAVFEYRRLVIGNPDGTINLSAPTTGNFALRPGQRIELATPTMDGGLWLAVALESVEEAPEPA